MAGTHNFFMFWYSCAIAMVFIGNYFFEYTNRLITSFKALKYLIYVLEKCPKIHCREPNVAKAGTCHLCIYKV